MKDTLLKTFIHGSLFSFAAMFIGGVINYLTRRYLALNLSEYNFGLFYGMFSFISIAGIGIESSEAFWRICSNVVVP